VQHVYAVRSRLVEERVVVRDFHGAGSPVGVATEIHDLVIVSFLSGTETVDVCRNAAGSPKIRGVMADAHGEERRRKRVAGR
jgi:hypothetical protein